MWAVFLQVSAVLADGEMHWSITIPVRPSIFQGGDEGGKKISPVDFLVAKEWDLQGDGHRHGFQERASKEVLLRRASLALTGLPPAEADVESFLLDDGPGAFERMVDRFLASPAYGERMAWLWMAPARYADTDGFQRDAFRSQWPWRDWVIEAFNAGMPLDRFTTLQLAGDLVEGADESTVLATAFNRNHRLNAEAGALPQEFRVENIADRAETVATVWLGLTLGCARCHDHPHDPVTQEEYYRFFALFAGIPEKGTGLGVPAAPVQRTASPLHRTPPWIQDHLNQLEVELATAGPERRTALRIEKAELEKQLESEGFRGVPVMVMKESDNPSTVHVLRRGQYHSPDPDRPVSPGIPSMLYHPDNAPVIRNRLDLARWMVSRQNPLTARVMVNRIWQQHFGRGLVETAGNFGSGGTPPAFPELLDWLALELIDSGWDHRHIHRVILNSAVWQQASGASPAQWKSDPHNRWLHRGPSWRLDGAALRDQAMAIAGILDHDIGGPPVFPPQPEGLWKAYSDDGALTYPLSSGRDLYRRSIYTFWKRTIAPPRLAGFSGSTREKCEVDISKYDTAQQSLILMNDPVFIEAAVAWAGRLMQETSSGLHSEKRAASWIHNAWEDLTCSEPPEDIHRQLMEAWRFFLRRYQSDPEAAMEFIRADSSHSGNMEWNASTASEQAALAAVCHLVMNLEQFISLY